jgi:hypothetical protein
MGDTSTELADTRNALDCVLSILNVDLGDLDPEGIADLAVAAKSLSETLVLLHHVAANESALRLTDAIVHPDPGATPKGRRLL